MSRKPVNTLRPDQTRQAIWEWIKINEAKNGPSAHFTVKQIVVGLNDRSIIDYLHGLTNAGYLVMTIDPRRGFPALFTLVRDNGQEAPRVRKDGSPVTQGLAREQLWRALGIFAQKGKTFTVRDLTLFASTEQTPVAESDAKHYCHHLYHSGYLYLVKPATGGKAASYRMSLLKWTGPKPVQIQRTRRCYDPNNGQVAHIAVLIVEGGE